MFQSILLIPIHLRHCVFGFKRGDQKEQSRTLKSLVPAGTKEIVVCRLFTLYPTLSVIESLLAARTTSPEPPSPQIFQSAGQNDSSELPTPVSKLSDRFDKSLLVGNSNNLSNISASSAPFFHLSSVSFVQDQSLPSNISISASSFQCENKENKNNSQNPNSVSSLSLDLSSLAISNKDFCGPLTSPQAGTKEESIKAHQKDKKQILDASLLLANLSPCPLSQPSSQATTAPR